MSTRAIILPMKKLLVVGYVWPEPNSSAAGTRMMELISSFQSMDYSVTYASPAAPSEHAIDYQEHDITPCSIELNDASFDAFILDLKPDAVLFDRFMMEEQFGWRVEKHCPNALRLLDTEDLHCLRQARQTLAKNNSNVIKAVPNHALYSDIAKREIAAIYRCDLTLMISQHEMQILKERFSVPESILFYLPFQIDTTSIDKTSFENRQHFVSIGNFRHEPNWDAVLQLKNIIWPLIRKRLPKAELHVYGAYPPKKATQLHNEKQGFHVKGWCENAKTVLNEARVLLAPLRFGAGLKGKLFDAAQCALPSVTTSIGAEGLEEDVQSLPFLVNDDFEKFAQLACDLYTNPDLWLHHQDQCESFLQAFQKAPLQTAFARCIQSLESDIDVHRLNNFTGSMLRHHSMKSTQYMAQWIEEKNKNK